MMVFVTSNMMVDMVTARGSGFAQRSALVPAGRYVLKKMLKGKGKRRWNDAAGCLFYTIRTGGVWWRGERMNKRFVKGI